LLLPCILELKWASNYADKSTEAGMILSTQLPVGAGADLRNGHRIQLNMGTRPDGSTDKFGEKIEIIKYNTCIQF
jgi:hypothetical protein